MRGDPYPASVPRGPHKNIHKIRNYEINVTDNAVPGQNLVRCNERAPRSKRSLDTLTHARSAKVHVKVSKSDENCQNLALFVTF